MIKQKRRVLITGGAGFVGSHLLKSLRDLDVSSIVVDNYSNSKLSKFGNSDHRDSSATFYDLDIRYRDKLEDILHEHEDVDACVHLAAKISLAESLRNPEETFDVNVNGTRNVLEVCVKFGIKNFVLASSSAVYGNSRKLPLSENENPQPISPYGQSKLQAEQLVSHYSNRIANAVSLRFFNIYGIGQSAEYAGVITKFIQRLQEGSPPLVYGSGKQTRDFVSVHDVIRAIILGSRLQYNHIGGGTERSEISPSKYSIFNIGTGIPTKIVDLANMIKEIFSVRKPGNSSSDLRPLHAPPVQGDIFESYADTTRSEQILGFKYNDELRGGLEKLYGQL